MAQSPSCKVQHRTSSLNALQPDTVASHQITRGVLSSVKRCSCLGSRSLQGGHQEATRVRGRDQPAEWASQKKRKQSDEVAKQQGPSKQLAKCSGCLTLTHSLDKGDWVPGLAEVEWRCCLMLEGRLCSHALLSWRQGHPAFSMAPQIQHLGAVLRARCRKPQAVMPDGPTLGASNRSHCCAPTTT